MSLPQFQPCLRWGLAITVLLSCTGHKTNLQSSLISSLHRRVGGLQTPSVVCVSFRVLYKCSQTQPLKALPKSNYRVRAMTQMCTSRADKAKGRHIPSMCTTCCRYPVFADPDESLLLLLRKIHVSHLRARNRESHGPLAVIVLSDVCQPPR
ncbi:hypothetical protein EDD37DRAFT_138874 [Exophiala viscosa]|uniref:Secreted protein n=1 Tax=Exophiala viscosa TaxID=2486360 RepID=A0AAN6DM19_9EURO|nr:hypothetical protein EDD36DRAFT_84061 [Exophiala viscosa]KAI1620947.1 hypothetical protein EDD37DRAFT_138874 [Exophiala viscosa]